MLCDLLSLYVLGAGNMLSRAREDFACTKAAEEDAHNVCSTLNAACEGEEIIAITSVIHRIKNTSEECSYNISDCKAIDGCCSLASKDTEKDLPLDEKVPIFQQCNGKRKCSVLLPEIKSNSLQSTDYMLLEYTCINGRLIILIQLTLVISTSLISNNRLSRNENLVPA